MCTPKHLHAPKAQTQTHTHTYTHTHLHTHNVSLALPLSREEITETTQKEVLEDTWQEASHS